MKKLFIIAVLLFSTITSAQEVNWQEFKKEAAIASHEAAEQTNIELGLKTSRMDAFNSEYSENIDTVTVDFQVLNIIGDKAQLIYKGKKYEVSTTPVLNPFGYILQADREYRIALERDMDLVYQYQTRGQNKTLPARMIWFTVSKDQVLRDQVQLDKFIHEEPGYDRSPRNGQ